MVKNPNSNPAAADLRRWLHPGVEEVHRDDVLWVLDKPAGVLSHPNPPATKATNALLRAPYDMQRELYRLKVQGERERQVHLAHRLDMETSGLIVCVFQAAAAATIKEDLYRHHVEKTYRALLVGCPRKSEGEWVDCLERRSKAGKVEVRVRQGGRPNAWTGYRVVERFDASGTALVALTPKSGRTHQLRVQAASRHCPIAGDGRYGDFTANRFLAERIGLKHMFLHAWRLELRHPKSGHRLEFRREFSRRLAVPLAAIGSLRQKVPLRR